MVVIGDSIPFGGHFCPGCTAFSELYAKTLESKLGRPVVVANRSRDDGARMDDIESQVKTSATLRPEIEAADIVIVSVGFNNTLPDPTTGIGCAGDIGRTIETYIAWALATTPACLKTGINTYAAQYDRIFKMISDLRKGKPTVYAVINVHDGNLGGSDFTEANVTKDMKRLMDRWIIAAYNQWNAMECGRAKAHGFACVDVYHAFNGPAGDQPSGLVNTIDGAHPSQAGNDVIAGLLAKLDTKAIAK
jgi:lysophospholipase L1-like esterase